jgi:non-reducing end alpha-L-arabinofuranosidase
MRLVRALRLAVSFTLLLGFACSSSSPSPADGSSGSTGVSGSAGHANHAGESATGGASGAGASGTGTSGTGGTGGGHGGSATSGGGSSAGGVTGSGGSGAAGASGTGGTRGPGAAGSSGSGAAGGGQTGAPPGDIASLAGTPLVAAHSVTRAMFAAYNGKLFQARRPTDSKTQDINTVGMGGFVDLTALNTFCSGTTCTVMRLYDQTANGNDLWQNTIANQPTVGFWSAANGMKYPMIVSKGYQWLRNRNQVSKIPTGSTPQTEYFVVHGGEAGRAAGTNGCCYDYGNMETLIRDDGPGTMTALYFGDASDWTRGAGNGPWVMLDMENGVFAGGGPITILNAGQSSVNANDPSLKYASPNIVMGLAKTDGKTTFELKYGNASMGTLSTAWNGSLPTKTNPTSYIPLKQQGGISLGEGGDGSAMGTGAFSEGAIMVAQTSDATDTAIQANLTTIYK